MTDVGTSTISIPPEIRMKTPAQEMSPVTVTSEDSSVPPQEPVHPANDAPATGVAVSVTTVPASKVAAQVPPALVQSMSPGALAIVPPSVGVTVRVKEGRGVRGQCRRIHRYGAVERRRRVDGRAYIVIVVIRVSTSDRGDDAGDE